MTFIGSGTFNQDDLWFDRPVNDVTLALLRLGMAKGNLSPRDIYAAQIFEGLVIFDVQVRDEDDHIVVENGRAAHRFVPVYLS